ncbi:MAG: hypothetical protein WBG38_08610 [Nodosilinea sp.]
MRCPRCILGARLTHILLGDYAALVEAINRMKVLRYCSRVAWIEPVCCRCESGFG